MFCYLVLPQINLLYQNIYMYVSTYLHYGIIKKTFFIQIQKKTILTNNKKKFPQYKKKMGGEPRK